MSAFFACLFNIPYPSLPSLIYSLSVVDVLASYFTEKKNYIKKQAPLDFSYIHSTYL